MPNNNAVVLVSVPSRLESVTRPDKLDLSTGQRDAFRLWKEKWNDHLLLSGLKDMEPRHQMAALMECLADDTLRVVRNMDLRGTEKNSVTAVLQRLEDYFIRQVDEVLERKVLKSRMLA